jgi:hypothetical protein
MCVVRVVEDTSRVLDNPFLVVRVVDDTSRVLDNP